jgi:hypothetical protein
MTKIKELLFAFFLAGGCAAAELMEGKGSGCHHFLTYGGKRLWLPPFSSFQQKEEPRVWREW